MSHLYARITIVVLVLTVAAAGFAASRGVAAAAAESAESARSAGPVGALPDCRQGDDPAPRAAYDQWASTLLDPQHHLSEEYVPPDLVSTARAGANGGPKVRRVVVKDLRAMVRAAGRDGVTLHVNSGYRGFEEQERLFRSYVRRLGPDDGSLHAARAGHSEHQLGTALDFAGTPGAHGWLAANGARFGFVVSFPPDGQATSCHRSEPWHLRYVGRERAAAIEESGLTPRAWLWADLAREHAVRATD